MKSRMHTTEVGAMVGTPLGTAVGMLVGAVGSQQGLLCSSLLKWPVTNELQLGRQFVVYLWSFGVSPTVGSEVCWFEFAYISAATH